MWQEDATQQDKENLWGNFNAANDEEFVQKYSEESGDFYKSFTFSFNDDGTVLCSKNESGALYYTQTDDLKTVRIYKNAELTNGYCILTYFDGNYCMTELTDYNATIYFKLERA